MDAQINTHLITLLGFEFDTLHEPFSIGIMIRSAVATLLFLLQDLIDIDSTTFVLLAYTGGLCGLGIVLCSITMYFEYTRT